MRTTFIKNVTNNSFGFTLVELAIVLMIIGLLVGGVLRGQEMMVNAQATATVQQVKSYQGAYHTFMDAFNNYPGDMAQATARIPNCTAANFCGNGNGDSKIGIPDADSAGANQSAKATLPEVETAYFWKHLALAHLISGIDPSSDPTKVAWGKTQPSAKIGGGFTIFASKGYTVAASPASNRYGIGHDLRLQPGPTDIGVPPGGYGVSPNMARLIDMKMDDGISSSGIVTAGSVTSGCEGAQFQYVQSEEKRCTMYFVLD